MGPSGRGGGFRRRLKKGARLRRGLCRRVVKGKVLKMDRPDGRRVRKFDGPSGRGLWIAAPRQCL